MKVSLLLAGIVAGLALVGLGFVSARTTVVPQPAAADHRSETAVLAARLGGIEERLRRLEPGTAPAPSRQAGDDRHLVALLHLQNVATTARPWSRELQLLLDQAGAGRLNPALVEVLRANAAQGVATRAELRRRFAMLRPALLADGAAETGLIHGLLQGGQSAAAGLGLAAPPPPDRTEATIADIGLRLDRGDLAGALHDAGLLDGRLRARLGDWTAQVRARLAVEQALQELLAQSLASGLQRP